MDKDFLISLSTIFDESTQEGIEYMERTLCTNKFSNYSQFKKYFQDEYKSTQCHNFWLFPKFCAVIYEPHNLYPHNNQTICLNCFVNSKMNKQPIPDNIRIQSSIFGKCKCGSDTCSNPFACAAHSPQQKKLRSNDLHYKEIIQNVVSVTFSKFDTVLKKKNFFLTNNGNESIITFIKELAEINDIFLAEVGDAILTNKDQIQKLILELKYYTYNINYSLCQLFSLLSFHPSFLNEFLLILLKISHLFITDCFKNVSRKLRDNTPSNPTLIWMKLYDFPIDFSIRLLDKSDFDSFEFAKNFISHFQSQILQTKFLDTTSYPIFYKRVLKIFQAQIEFISRKENENEEEEPSQSIQFFFDSVFEALNELESNFDTKFMEFTEDNKFLKLVYLYEFTYDIVKLFFSRDESQYKVSIDTSGLIDIVFCALDYNFISENLFDSNETESKAETEVQADKQANENLNEAKTQANDDDNDGGGVVVEFGTESKDDDDDDNADEREDSILTKSIRSENVNVSLFNQLIHFFSFYIVNLQSPIINLRDSIDPSILLYGSIIPARLLTWHFSYKMNLGSTFNEGGDSFFKAFNNDEKRRKYLFYGNFGYIQIASLLLESDQLEQLVNMIASSFGLYEKSTINNNLDEYLPTLKLCFIFFIGCLYFDRYTSLRSKVGENDGKSVFRMIQMIHRLKQGNVYLNALNRKEYDTIEKVAFKRKTTNDRTIYCLKKKEELPINWNPFYVINPINEVISLLANEIPSKGLLILPSVEDELKSKSNVDDEKFEGLEFHHILMTPTVYSVIYSIISDFFIEKQKNVESIHLSLNLLLVIISKLELNEELEINEKYEKVSANNLHQLTLLCSCKFEEFVIKKIDFIGRGEHSLLDLLLKLNEISDPVIKELKKKFPSLIKENKNDDNKDKLKNSNRARELKRTISEKFQSQIDLFKSSSLNAEFLEEEEEEETNGACQICHTFKENEGLCYMIYIYETTLPSYFEPFKDGLPRDVFQFSICNHLFHRNCAFQETGVPPTDSDFPCPIDRFNKNAIMPKIDGYGELDETTIFELNIFFVNLNSSFEKVVISFTSIFVLNEIRFRLNEIQDQVKYSSQILLARNLYFILWHAIRKLDMKIDKTGMTLFQRFISSLLSYEFHGNVLKYKKRVALYSSRVDGKEKTLFLRRCRVFEHFIFTCSSNDTLETRLHRDELSNKKLWEHFEVESDVDKAETEYEFLCDQFKKHLTSNYIELCKSIDSATIYFDNRVAAVNLIDGSIVKNRWGANLAFLLDFILNEDEEVEIGSRFPNLQFLNSLNNRQQQQQQQQQAAEDDFWSDDSEVFYNVVESEFEDQESNASKSANNNSDVNENNDNENANSGNESANSGNDNANSGNESAPNAVENSSSSNTKRGIPPSNSRNSPMLLMMIGSENSMVIITHEKRFIELKPFYVDADGEPDVGFKRQRMLYFNEANYEHAVDTFLSGDFTMNLSSIYF